MPLARSHGRYNYSCAG